MNTSHARDPRIAALALAALGVVFGDIGTSPLYSMKEVFAGNHPIALHEANLLGCLSLFFWALMIVVSFKYVFIIMRADNRGEGGIMALIALALHEAHGSRRKLTIISVIGILGAAMFYGDGMVTPAISVLSAVEGLEVIAPGLEPFVIPITLAVLFGLFFVQRRGTGGIGIFFGPVMLLWFATLAVLGIYNLIRNPHVLLALNPMYGAEFLWHNRTQALLAMGNVVLAVTGAEALYADMGHFGRRPIQIAWYGLVLPSLVLNYFGQGALLLAHPETKGNPFFLAAPEWALIPLVGLATVATVIASQAVISGAFSISRQAIQLGFLPRMEVQHTSEQEQGQIYLPGINWGLMIGVMLLVLGFRSSANLAAAYGIAVTSDMVITSLLATIVVAKIWKWGWTRAILLFSIFLAVELVFLAANVLKIPDGGWFPLVAGLVIFTLMTTWKRGRRIVVERMHTEAMPLNVFIEVLHAGLPTRVPGTSVFMHANPDGVPHALLHNLMHNKVLHERVVLLSVKVLDAPHVPRSEQVEVEPLQDDFYRVLVRYGFMDEPDIPAALAHCSAFGLEFDMMETSFFLGRETLIARPKSTLALWRQKIFIVMSRNASSATTFFKIPSNRVVELGAQVVL